MALLPSLNILETHLSVKINLCSVANIIFCNFLFNFLFF